MKVFILTTSIIAAIKAVWTRESPFAAATALFPTNKEGKYIIESEGIRLAFTNNGGALTNLWIDDTNGNELDIVMGFDFADAYLKYPGNPFLNGVIGELVRKNPRKHVGDGANSSWSISFTPGRYAGVISGGQFELDGLTPDSRQYEWEQGITITFVLFDRGWNGFPGTAAACLTHTVTPYEWRIAFGVTPTRKATPINLSQQVFWNLNGFAANSSMTVAEHRLHLPFSGLRLDMDAGGIPTGDLRANKRGSAYDFWAEGKQLGRGLAQLHDPEACQHSSAASSCDRYDETFLVARPQPWKKEEYPVAILSSAYSGISVSLYTDQEALHVHTWDSEPEPVTVKQAQGTGTVPRFGAISMEMQDLADAINNPEWQRAGRTVWGMDRLYTAFSSFKFTVDEVKEGKGSWMN
ncbi:putative aldose 1-epimerase family protein [Aspergillus undulatus]|uniref:putative aldose 1-epimerase family protein n=1 Tax=Aspergillus undulatus TaxID=1810928 RepID=UPI003CCDC428